MEEKQTNRNQKHRNLAIQKLANMQPCRPDFDLQALRCTGVGSAHARDPQKCGHATQILKTKTSPKAGLFLRWSWWYFKSKSRPQKIHKRVLATAFQGSQK